MRAAGRSRTWGGVTVAMVRDMNGWAGTSAPGGSAPLPAQVPSGAALLALELSREARGITGLDVLRRSVDRAPPR